MFKRAIFYVLPALILLAPLFADAAPTGVPKTIGALVQALCTVANWMFSALLVLGVIAFLYAGFMFLTAGGGNTDRVSTAKKYFFYAAVGIGLAALARALVFIIANLVGANVTGLGCTV